MPRKYLNTVLYISLLCELFPVWIRRMIPATPQLTEFRLLVEISDVCMWNDCKISNSLSHQAKLLPVLEGQGPIPIRQSEVFFCNL